MTAKNLQFIHLYQKFLTKYKISQKLNDIFEIYKNWLVLKAFILIAKSFFVKKCVRPHLWS